MEITIAKNETDQNVYCTMCPRRCYLYTLSFTNETTNQQGQAEVIFAPEYCPIKDEL